jgi:hypothetical protein
MRPRLIGEAAQQQRERDIHPSAKCWIMGAVNQRLATVAIRAIEAKHGLPMLLHFRQVAGVHQSRNGRMMSLEQQIGIVEGSRNGKQLVDQPCGGLIITADRGDEMRSPEAWE